MTKTNIKNYLNEAVSVNKTSKSKGASSFSDRYSEFARLLGIKTQGTNEDGSTNYLGSDEIADLIKKETNAHPDDHFIDIYNSYAGDGIKMEVSFGIEIKEDDANNSLDQYQKIADLRKEYENIEDKELKERIRGLAWEAKTEARDEEEKIIKQFVIEYNSYIASLRDMMQIEISKIFDNKDKILEKHLALKIAEIHKLIETQKEEN